MSANGSALDNSTRLPPFIQAVMIFCLLALPCLGVAQTSTPPRLGFSTYLGGSGEDSVRAIATDRQGNIYLSGGTSSSNFPVTSGAYDTTFNGWHDVFVTKLDSNGHLLWSTFLGGPNYDRAYAIEVDSMGYIYVAGRAGEGYPTTPGSVQPRFGGDIKPGQAYGRQDGFVTKLSPDGTQVIWSTYFGGDDGSYIRDIAVDDLGNVYLVLDDVSRPNPYITPGAFQTSLQGGTDMVVAKISSDGATMLYASYLGGSGDDGQGPSIRVDRAGHAYVLGTTNSVDIPTTSNAYNRTMNGGTDVYVAKFAPDGSNLVYGTYLGGSQSEGTETHQLAIDAQGNAYIAAYTSSPDLPTTPGAFQRTYGDFGPPGSSYPGDGFVAKISSDGSTLLASTFIGGRLGDFPEGIAVNSQGDVYVSGSTVSDNFPVTPDALQTSHGGEADVFAIKLSADFSRLIYSTHLGGTRENRGRAVCIDLQGNLYVVGMTQSDDWPLQNAIQSSRGGNWDGVIAKLVFTP